MKSSDFKIVFFGTSDFAEVILKYLIESEYQVVAVVTRPDKPTGRSLKMTYSPVKSYCLNTSPPIPLHQPSKVSTEEFQKVLAEYQPDLFVVAAFGEIIKPNILSIPKAGSINVHPSLLPKYRGPSPMQAALLNGDTETGVCIIDVAERMDAGVIYAQKTFPIEKGENFSSLQLKALAHTKEILMQVVKAKQSASAVGKSQLEDLATYCKKILPEDEKINWSHSLISIYHQIQALSEVPGAWTYLKVGKEVKRCKIYEAELLTLQQAEGLNVKKHLIVQRDGITLKINALQLEGKKRLCGSEFLCGIKSNYFFI